ncbi:MAG: L-seryl-tRNA(Sec) selenium transferase [Halanaerobium sp.]
MKKEYLKSIPSVNDILAEKQADKIIKEFSRDDLIEGIRSATDKIRGKILADDFNEDDFDSDCLEAENILIEAGKYLKSIYQPKMTAAINAAGVIVHTNLGRSILSAKAVKAVKDVAEHYSTLEIDRETGERGHRYQALQDILKKLTGAEAAVVVNNNAGAVTIALAALAKNKEVVISRGELVEIGGSFRVPEVMEQSGAELVEVGATNKVYLKDYINAFNENTGAFLKVHTSNYRIMGFTETVNAADLTEFAHQKDIPVIEDLGSGILFDLQEYGLSYEPTVKECIEDGIDIVTFSGDKLLGGPQAGIIVGKKKYIDQIEYHPLMRALRVDKFTIAALEATLKQYKDFEEAITEIPTLRMLTEAENEVKNRAEKLFELLEKNNSYQLEIIKDSAKVGGGAYPLIDINTYVLAIDPQNISAENLAYKLRQAKVPVFSRISEGSVLLDMKTIQESEIEKLAEILNNVFWRKENE